MSVFSDLLRSYIERCGITVVTLAKQCGADRSTLHKIISGERRAPSPEFVIKLSGLLMLSSAERELLIEQYEISLVGDELYRRRRNVMEMIKKLSGLGKNALPQLSGYYRINRSVLSDHSVHHSRHELLRAGYSMLTAELEEGNDIVIIAQPDEDFCYFMKYASAHYKGSSIRHIFCLDNRCGTDDSNDYNLALFPGVCELTYYFSGYVPEYYYDNIDSHINSATLLPVMLAGKSFVLCADNKSENGVIYRMDDVIGFYREQFSRLESMCSVFIERAGNVAGMVGTGSYYHDYSLTFDEQPSLMLVSEEDCIRSTLRLPQEQLERFVGKVRFLKERYYGKDYTVIFSAEGLAKFMSTGIILELPGEVCTPVPPENRIKTLEDIIGKTEQDIYKFRVIENGIAPSEYLRINLDIDGAVHFVLRTHGEYVFMTVGEQSVRMAMHDYFEHLFESGKIYDKDRSLEVMRGVLSAARAELGMIGEQ